VALASRIRLAIVPVSRILFGYNNRIGKIGVEPSFTQSDQDFAFYCEKIQEFNSGDGSG
jgi:hypothetical protein